VLLTLAYILTGGVLGALSLAFVKWFLHRPQKVEMPLEMIHQLNRFSDEFQRVAKNLQGLSNHFEMHSLKELKIKNLALLRSLRQVNRVLHKLNKYLERLGQPLPTDKVCPDTGEFTDSREATKFGSMGRISQSEIQSVDWDELLRRLGDHD